MPIDQFLEHCRVFPRAARIDPLVALRSE